MLRRHAVRYAAYAVAVISYEGCHAAMPRHARYCHAAGLIGYDTPLSHTPLRCRYATISLR